jgi:hypothetical protein
LGAASSSQATAPRNGGVTNEAITRMRTAPRSGMSVRATIHPIGAATRQQMTLTEVAIVSVVSSGSTKAGSVKSVWKLASVGLRARSVKANTASQPIGRMISRHSTAANSPMARPDTSKRGRAVRKADDCNASTLKCQAFRVTP